MTERSTTVLAFIGDAVYELYIRTHVAGGVNGSADILHKRAVRYVRAETQASSVKEMMTGFLTDEEIALVKRARNHKGPNRSRSAGAVEYKLATAFEALIGALYLDGKIGRAEQIMEKAVALTDGRGDKR